MTRHTFLPVALGALMGVAMLWMIHGKIISGDAPDLTVLAVFIGLHVAVIGVVLLLPLIASPGLRRWLSRRHRPDARHFSLMIGGAALGAAALHLALHGVAH